MKSEIGECVCVLFHKLWDRTLLSEREWKWKLKALLNHKPYPCPVTKTDYPKLAAPITYEVEFNLDNKSDCL